MTSCSTTLKSLLAHRTSPFLLIIAAFSIFFVFVIFLMYSFQSQYDQNTVVGRSGDEIIVLHRCKEFTIIGLGRSDTPGSWAHRTSPFLLIIAAFSIFFVFVIFLMYSFQSQLLFKSFMLFTFRCQKLPLMCLQIISFCRYI
jgi:hypothetical protein